MRFKTRILFSLIALAAITLAFLPATGPRLRYLKNTGNPASCTPVRADCNQLPCLQCRVLTPGGLRSVYSGTDCTLPVSHSTGEILLPQ